MSFHFPLHYLSDVDLPAALRAQHLFGSLNRSRVKFGYALMLIGQAGKNSSDLLAKLDAQPAERRIETIRSICEPLDIYSAWSGFGARSAALELYDFKFFMQKVNSAIKGNKTLHSYYDKAVYLDCLNRLEAEFGDIDSLRNSVSHPSDTEANPDRHYATVKMDGPAIKTEMPINMLLNGPLLDGELHHTNDGKHFKLGLNQQSLDALISIEASMQAALEEIAAQMHQLPFGAKIAPRSP